MDLGLKCYPNPTAGIITLAGYDITNAHCTVRNNLGQVIHEQQLDIIGQTQLDLTNNPSGLYVVTVEKDGLSWSQKVVLTN